MKELVQKVKQWGIDKGLDKVGHLAQAEYTLKETAELLDAYADKDIDEINDAFGDVLVTLIVGASNNEEVYKEFMNNLPEFLTFDDSHLKNTAFLSLTGMSTMRHLIGEIAFLMNQSLIQNVRSDHYKDVVDGLYCMLFGINNEFNQKLSLQDCLQLAYDEIKDRTGKLNADGHFIKD